MDDEEISKAVRAARKRQQDRDDLWTETAGLNNGRMKNFVTDPDDPRTREGKERIRAAETERRTAAQVARWDAQMTTIGGTQMTNAEAQAARRRILENGDHYAKIARDRGLIKPGQEEAFLAAIREEHDLNEADRQGTISESQRGRLEAIRNSDIGRAAHETIAQFHRDHGLGQARESFPSAKPVSPEFAAAVSGETRSRPEPAAPKPTPAGSGLDL